MKNEPWSSSGRKPVGVTRISPKTATANAPTSTIEMIDKRTILRTSVV